MIYKPYEHPGFPSNTFNHSNYEYRNYKTSAPPDFKPYKHPRFPAGTFEHSNYGYRNNKSGLGAPGSRSNSVERTPTPQIPDFGEPPAKKQKRDPPEPLKFLPLQTLPPLRQILQQLPTAQPRARRPSTSSSSALSSVQFISPPITPDTGNPPSRSAGAETQNQSTRLIIRVPRRKSDPVAPAPPPQRSIEKQRERSPPPALRARTPPPSAYDPTDPDGEFSRPSVTTLVPWEEDDGSTSMVQDYRLLMGGELMVGKVESEW
jgi:hypothetical protein